jgi:hypothetical protein
MTDWLSMAPVEFDQALAPTRQARKFVETAPETMFPRLLPEPARKATPAPDPMGTPDMFATEGDA